MKESPTGSKVLSWFAYVTDVHVSTNKESD